MQSLLALLRLPTLQCTPTATATAGLYLPTSDVDAVIIGSGCSDVPQGLKALANSLARKSMAKNMQVGSGWVGVWGGGGGRGGGGGWIGKG